MDKNNEEDRDLKRLRRTSLARLVRSLITSLTIPSIITACAPVPHAGDSVGHSAGNSKTILYVRSRGKKSGEDRAVSDDGADQLETALSPGSRYVPLPSDAPIFEKILAKYKISSLGKTSSLKPASLPSPPRPRAAYAMNLTPPVSIKSLKDGIWDRVRKRLMLTAVDHEAVYAQVQKISNSPGALEFLAKRAEPFLFYIVDEIERRGLPMDLALVPMVESAYDPGAVSPKQAAGLWQFIEGTAVEHGLKVSDGYDGRFDVYASTKAALKYLSHLHGLFGGDWLLALAAYNAGEGAVQRAIATNQKAGLGASFWELNLPAETKAYVPRILALSRVIAAPDNHGLKLRKISPLPYLARVEVNGNSAQLAQAIAGTGMNLDEFYGLNPALKPGVTPHAPFNLLLPTDKAEKLTASLQETRLIAARRYVVKKGETLAAIAKQQGVPPLKLAEWNGLKADSRVKPGQELIIYPV